MATESGSHIIGQLLPEIRGSKPGTYRHISKSKVLNPKTQIPETLASLDISKFNACITTYEKVKEALKIELPPVEVEGSHVLNTEGDVERACSPYYLHSVNLILEKLLSQLKYSPGELRCMAQYTDGDTRTDIKYFLGKVPFLTVEYKRTNVLRDADWTTQALIRPDRTADDILRLSGTQMPKKPSKESFPLLNNAEVIATQASKYHKKTSIILVHDYISTVVLDFKANGKTWNNRTNPVQYWFSNERTTGITHRQVLFAALIRGLERIGVKVGE